jgi:plastocyanin
MAVYFVLGSILVAWGLGLAILGLLREDFPPGGSAGRALVGVTVLIVAGTLTALLVTTKREHPREEAAAEAAALKEEQKNKSGGPGTAPATPAAPGSAPKEQAPAPAPPKPSGQTVQVTEKEFSIALAGSKSLKAGSYTFDVLNQGKIQHDLTIDGDGVKKKKTKLIDGGKSAKLSVKLKPAKYKFYCSVPGHEQAGMKVNVTVVK